MTTLDISNHDYPTFTPNCFVSKGVRRLIIGCWDYDLTADMLQRSRAAGIVVEDLYAYLYYGLAHEQREVANAVLLAESYGGIKRVWLDCEAQPPHEVPGISPGQRVSRTGSAVRTVELAGIEPGIYTYEPYWRNQMANTMAFSQRKLWLANYGLNDPNNPRPPIRTVGFGGWAKVAAHQYSSTIVVCARNRDHNYWFLEEDDMTPEEREWMTLARNVLTKDQMQAWIEKGNVPLLQAFATEQTARGATTNSLNTHIAEHPTIMVEDHHHGGVER